MHTLIAVGVGCYSGGFQHSPAINVCALAFFTGGAALLAAAFWHLRKAPELQEATLPPSESPRR
ncbi:MAG: hypothetical protein HY926_10630 [Elusimicrobia bacterium]|nr:hypothetical protein [Elusimicrobiota bacterium]